MEPAFHRGDLLLLTHDREEPIRVGDIVVFKIEGREIPIVHRVLKVHEKYPNYLVQIIKSSSNLIRSKLIQNYFLNFFLSGINSVTLKSDKIS